VFKFLIQSARNTALGTHIVRGLQGLGYPRNIPDVYEEAFKDESLITVPCDPAESRPWGRLMLPRRTGIIYFGPGTVETLTAL
jgi:hypothetical protein